MKKGLHADYVTRDEINEAVKQYLKKGGKIKRIEVQTNNATTMLGDSFDFNDPLTSDDFSLRDLNFTSSGL